MPEPDRTRAGPLDFFRIGDHAAKKKSSSQLSWLSAATQPQRDFAAELRREFLMAGFDAIGSRFDFFPCTGVWNLLVRHVGSSRRCSIKAHGEVVIMRRRAALASALRTAATFPLWLRLNPSTFALFQLAVLLRRRERTGPASMPAAASSGVKASGGRAESEGVAHAFDFPTRPRRCRCVCCLQ